MGIMGSIVGIAAYVDIVAYEGMTETGGAANCRWPFPF